MLEKYKQSKKPEFRIYMLETSPMIPWFYTEIKGEKRKELYESFKEKIEDERKAREEERAAAKKKGE